MADELSEIKKQLSELTKKVDKMNLYLLGDEAITGVIDEVKSLKSPKKNIKPTLLITSISGGIVALVEIIKTWMK